MVSQETVNYLIDRWGKHPPEVRAHIAAQEVLSTYIMDMDPVRFDGGGAETSRTDLTNWTVDEGPLSLKTYRQLVRDEDPGAALEVLRVRTEFLGVFAQIQHTNEVGNLVIRRISQQLSLQRTTLTSEQIAVEVIDTLGRALRGNAKVD
jgi:hypothetical protein